MKRTAEATYEIHNAMYFGHVGAIHDVYSLFIHVWLFGHVGGTHDFLPARTYIAMEKITEKSYTEAALKTCARKLLDAEPSPALCFKQRACARKPNAERNAKPALKAKRRTCAQG